MNVIFKSVKSTDDNGITAVHWDFGDGTMSTDANPHHTFDTAGTYTARLTVTDADGLSSTQAIDITALDNVGAGQPPVADIQLSTSRGEAPLLVTLDGSGSTSQNTIVSYEWDFGGGNYSYGPIVNHIFKDAYNYEVFLTVTDDEGLSHETSVELTAILSVPKGVPTTPGNYQTDGNPFSDSAFYVSPDIEVLQNQSLALIDPVTQPELYENIRFVQQMPSAVWLDRTIAITGGEANDNRRSLAGHFDEAVRQQQALAVDGNLPPMTVVIIVYNLPDRDCAALASNGLLNETNDGDGDGLPDGTGMQAYKEEYIDVIANIFSQYDSLRIVAMLEPDGYPNMITNVGKGFPKCDDVNAEGVYVEALQYAIGKFADMNNVYTYLDIGHSGWLGWDNTASDNLQRAVAGFTNLVAGATPSGRLDSIKGFASNTSGYTPLREPYVTSDFAARQNLADFYEWNVHVDELSFIDSLYGYFVSSGFPDDVGFIIDTARNGWGGPNRPTGEGAPGTKDDADHRVDLRTHRGHWCNIDEAGIGEMPQADPDPSRPYLDAYYWMKPPGESDGISDPSAIDANDEGKSYDPMCGGESSNSTGVAANVLLDAPHAGHWFHDQFIMLIENAFPELGVRDSSLSFGPAPSFIDNFDSYNAGTSVGGDWTVVKEGAATLEVTEEKFYGLEGKSIKVLVPEESANANSIAMLRLNEPSLSGATSTMYGRLRAFVEDDGSDDAFNWTMVTASGDNMQRQWNDLQFRFGVEADQLVAVADSNLRGPTCNAPSSITIPKDRWSCIEWKFDASGNAMSFWVDGELLEDLQIHEDFPGCSNQSWLGPDSWQELYLGVARYKPAGQQQQNNDVIPPKPDVSMYFDDVAVSGSRLGCGRVRN